MVSRIAVNQPDCNQAVATPAAEIGDAGKYLDLGYYREAAVTSP